MPRITKLDITTAASEFMFGYLSVMTWIPCTPSGDLPPWSRGMYAPNAADLAEVTSKRTLLQAKDDCDKFVFEALLLTELDLTDNNQAGVQFFFTREHHGQGFWDGELDEELGEENTKKLDALAKSFSEIEPEVINNIVQTLGTTRRAVDGYDPVVAVLTHPIESPFQRQRPGWH